MNKRIIAIFILAACSSLAFAGGKGFDRIASKLELDEAQSVEFERIMDENKQARLIIREEAQAKMAALKLSQQEKLSTVLTEEQLNAYMEMMEARQDRMKNAKRSKKKNVSKNVAEDV